MCPLPWMLLCLLPHLGHLRTLGALPHLIRVLRIPAPLSPACFTDGDHTAPRQLGMAAGSNELVTAGAEGLELATLSPKCFMDSSPSALCKYWHMNLETSCCFHTPIPVYPSGLLLTAVQIIDTFGFPKQAVFLRVPKLPDYLVIVLLMPKAYKAFSEVYSCTQML